MLSKVNIYEQNTNNNIYKNNNINFKARTFLPKEAEDMFIKASKQEQKNILAQIGKMFGTPLVMVASVLGLDKIMKKDEEIKELAFVDYPIKLSNNINIQMPDGTNLDKSQITKMLELANECTLNGLNEYKYIVFNPLSDIEDLKEELPNINPKLYEHQNLDYKNLMTLYDDGTAYFDCSESYKDHYFAEPESCKKGKSRIVKFDRIPMNKEVCLMNSIPYKFIVIPHGSSITMNENSTKAETDMVLLYKHPNVLRMLSSKKFLNIYHPTNENSVKQFEEIYENIPADKPDNTVYEKKAGFDVIKGKYEYKERYKKDNVYVSERFYEYGTSDLVRMNEEELNNINAWLEREFQKNPNLEKYIIKICIHMPMSDVSVFLTPKDAKPWEEKDIVKKGEFKDKFIEIDLSDVK